MPTEVGPRSRTGQQQKRASARPEASFTRLDVRGPDGSRNRTLRVPRIGLRGAGVGHIPPWLRLRGLGSRPPR
jgi:hypothetical protein